MHGLILAGGEGRRLAEDGIPAPKPLMSIAGQPQIVRLMETLRALRCDTLTCMVHRTVDLDVLPEAARGGARIVPCETASSLHTLTLGFATIPPGPVFCTMVDTVMPWEAWQRVWTACAGDLAQGAPAVLVVAPVPADDPSPLCAHTDAVGHVVALDSDRTTAEWATAGVYAFAPSTRQRAERAIRAGVQRMRGFLSSLVAEGAAIPLVTVDRALDVDRRRDLDTANRWAATFHAPTSRQQETT